MNKPFHFGRASRLGVALLFLALFVLPPDAYGADVSPAVEEGNEAYETKDYARARALFDQACKAGDPSGCHNLGVMFDEGEDGVQDKVRARALYDQACAAGNPGGCSHLGAMFDQQQSLG